MSTYSTINGFIQYQTKDDLNKSVTFLQNGKWMDTSFFWLDEGGQRVYDHPSVSVNELKLTINSYIYKNLLRYIDELLIGSSESRIRLYSTDGEYFF